MKFEIYAIKDTKTNYRNILLQQNQNVARRTFKALANDKNSEINTYAEDMELWRLGTWDNITGQITAEEPCFICKAIDYKEDNE